jgi:DNA polymerase III delta prime subunit
MPEVPEHLRHKYHYKRNPYPTDMMLDGMDDRALLRHMGVPTKYWEDAIMQASQPMKPTVEDWIVQLPYIFRPQEEHQREKPGIFGMGLIFYGPSGTGKTTASVALLLRLIRMLIPNADPTGSSRWYGACMGAYVGWQDFSRIARENVGNESEEYEHLMTIMKPEGSVFERGDFLVVDDISRERVTDFNLGELTYLLRHRNEWGFPTILTTNTPPEDWKEKYGEVMGAFMHRSVLPVEFDGHH